MELARERGHPEGSSKDGYELIAPLDEHGRIEPTLWRKYRHACGVRRFRAGQDDELGHLVRRRGGWAFHYDELGEEEDETGYRFESERFEVGEYVSIQEGAVQHTYRVVAVGPV